MKSIYRIFAIILLALDLNAQVPIQNNVLDGVQKNPNFIILQNIKLNTSFIFGGGIFIGAGYGFGIRMNSIQPGVNFSINGRFGQNNLGNRDHYKTRYQVNTIISPLVSINLTGNKRGYYEEISPGYFGIVSGLNSNYLSSITLGSSFVVMPRGIGRNIETSRNRTQQLFYTQVKIGWKYKNAKADSIGSFQINLYEDFLGTDNALLQGFADNFDRFFTGGGNAQLRINNAFKLKMFSEVYTGANYRDSFDYPDWVDTVQAGNDNVWGRKKIKRQSRYAYQDQGQQSYNKGRTFFVVEYAPNILNYKVDNFKPNLHAFQFLVGSQKPESMRSQNYIHSTISKIDKLLPEYSSKTDYLSTRKKERDQLHFFQPYSQSKKLLVGLGYLISSN